MAIKSLEELRKLRDDMQTSLRIRQEGESSDCIEILVGMGTCGIAAGARDTFHKFLDVIEEKDIENIKVVTVGCLGYCSQEPTVEFHFPNRPSLLYGKVTKNVVDQIVQRVLIEEDVMDDNHLIKTFEKVGV
jgi:NADP-reducing hydrogenase subunit HndB